MLKKQSTSLISKLSTLGLLSSLTLLLGYSSVSAETKVTSKSSVSDLTSRTPAYKREWVKTPFGPFASPVEGNFAKGKHITLLRFPAGFKTPCAYP